TGTRFGSSPRPRFADQSARLPSAGRAFQRMIAALHAVRKLPEGRRAMWSLRKKLEIPPPEQCLPGRAIRMRVPEQHFVNGHPLEPPYPPGPETAGVRMGGFLGARGP